MAPSDPLTPRSGFLEALLDVLKKAVRRDKMPNAVKTTKQSLIYRRKAADLARLAEAERDEGKVLVLVQQGLSWIQFAENEEILSEQDKPQLQ